MTFLKLIYYLWRNKQSSCPSCTSGICAYNIQTGFQGIHAIIQARQLRGSSSPSYWSECFISTSNAVKISLEIQIHFLLSKPGKTVWRKNSRKNQHTDWSTDCWSRSQGIQIQILNRSWNPLGPLIYHLPLFYIIHKDVIRADRKMENLVNSYFESDLDYPKHFVDWDKGHNGTQFNFMYKCWPDWKEVFFMVRKTVAGWGIVVSFCAQVV